MHIVDLWEQDTEKRNLKSKVFFTIESGLSTSEWRKEARSHAWEFKHAAVVLRFWKK